MEPCLFPVRERVPRFVAESLDRPPAIGRLAVIRDVGLQPRLPQALARSIREGGDAIGCDPEDGRDLVRVHSLHFRVPEDRLPSFGKAAEGTHGEGAVEGERHRVLRNGVVLQRVKVIDLHIGVVPAPPARNVADRRVQVGAKSARGAPATQNRLVDAGVGL